MERSHSHPGTGPVAWPKLSFPLRVLAVAALAGLSGSLFYSHIHLQIGALPLWMFAALLYSGFVGVSATLIFWLLPKLSQFVVFTAISRFFLAGTAALEPDIAVTLTTSPLLNATLVVGLAILMRRFVRNRPGLRDFGMVRA